MIYMHIIAALYVGIALGTAFGYALSSKEKAPEAPNKPWWEKNNKRNKK